MEAAELSELKVKSKMADEAQIFNYMDPDISGTVKARDFKFSMCINY